MKTIKSDVRFPLECRLRIFREGKYQPFLRCLELRRLFVWGGKSLFYSQNGNFEGWRDKKSAAENLVKNRDFPDFKGLLDVCFRKSLLSKVLWSITNRKVGDFSKQRICRKRLRNTPEKSQRGRSLSGIFSAEESSQCVHFQPQTRIKRKSPAERTGLQRTKKMVGIARFELATFCPPDKRANQAALYPVSLWCSIKKMKHNITILPVNARSNKKKILFFRPPTRFDRTGRREGKRQPWNRKGPES